MQLANIGVTPAKEKQFNKKGIYAAEDLVRFFPRKYNDYSVITGILPEEFESTLVLKVKDVCKYTNKTPMIIAKCVDIYTKDNVNVSWFNQSYLYGLLMSLVGSEIFVAGRVTYNPTYHNYSVSSPVIFSKDVKSAPKIYPVYSKIEGMSEKYLCEKVSTAVSLPELLRETCPRHVVDEQDLMSTREAICELHCPQNMKNLVRARDRMVFDDLLYYALRMEYAERKVSKGSAYNIKTLKMMKATLSSLPFSLTNDQQKTLNDILDFAREGKRINALVQGDVSCGKTIVAFLVMIAMADSGYQAAIMAPTQVLAKQHYEDLCKLVKPLGLNVAYFGGSSMGKKERARLLDGLNSGEINLVVGTHALLSKDIAFNKLALVVTDEEHKFGVVQRAALVEKAADGVHSITMSATPIPRSLAQVIYGNGVQLHTIKTMPVGRLPVKTAINSNFASTFKFLHRELSSGRQVYVVCPMIDKNEDIENVKSVEEISRIYNDEFASRGYTVGTLTGRNKKEETDEIIEKFKNNEINILVATTVIEVGVNVPNASVIVIQNAERFGLAGLHQLRGRVGRGKYQSYCILFSEEKENERLLTMVQTTDGFKIAEADLKLRGAGEFVGTRQSGEDRYMDLMLTYPERYECIKKIAANILDSGEDCIALEKLLEETEKK